MKTILLKSTLVSLFLLLGLIHSVRSQSLPIDFPTYKVVSSGKTAPGKIFLANVNPVKGLGYYMMILNENGSVYRYKKSAKKPINFTMQCDGRVSMDEIFHQHGFTGGGDVIYKLMDTTLTVVDSVQLGNEYLGEAHDFVVLPNGHKLGFCFYPKQFDVSNLIKGGYPNANVYSTVIQELDTDGKVVFQWRLWDHFNLSDMPIENLTVNADIDISHTNSIEMDTDGNLIFSCLNLGTITKISRQTGAVMWQLGGKFNKFRFTNVDSLKAVQMFAGHDCRRASNGNLTMIVNSKDGKIDPSRVMEWKLDELNLTATKVWEYNSQNIFATVRGSARRLANGNTIIGWGDDATLNGPACSEVDSTGKKVFELTFDNTLVASYRALRFNFPAVAKLSMTDRQLGVGTFNYIQGDTLDSGVSLNINNLDGDGYNSLKLEVWDIAPLKPQFPGKAPRALKNKIILQKTNIQSLKGSIIFDGKVFGIKNPNQITVYTRKYPDKLGLFIPVSTSYNSVTGKITADLSMTAESDFLELILTYPDLKEMAVTPKTSTPVNGAIVNNNLPIRMEWNSDGFINDFNLQIATDSTFSNPVINTEGLPSTVYYFRGAKTNQQYYWRVRTNNDDGYSNWSKIGIFVAGSPEIAVLSPKGDEVWKRGLKYFIQYKANIKDSVVIDLYKDGYLLKSLGKTANNMPLKWTIPMTLDSICGYYIVAHRLSDAKILGRSPKTFSIQNTTCVNTQVPFINVLKPVANEKWKQGTTHTISWSDNMAGELQLTLYKNGILVQDISSTTGNNLTWQVPVNTPIGNDYQIKISDKLNPVYSALSENIEITDSIQTSNIGLNLGSDEFSVYPNPVNDNMTVNFYLENPTAVTLEIFDMLGVKVDSWNHLEGKSGFQTVTKNIRNIPSGIYLVKLKTNNKTLSKRVIVKKQ